MPAMRLYLSSFRMGDHPENVVALVDGDSHRAVVIAIGSAPPPERRTGAELELATLAAPGFYSAELDLRDYFTDQRRLRCDLAELSLAWVRGDNVFMLRSTRRSSHHQSPGIPRHLLSSRWW